MKLRLILAAAAVFGTAALLSSACGGSSNSNSDVIAGISYIDTAGLHEMNEEIVNTGKIPADAHTVAVKLQTVTLLTEWPDDLDSQAKALAALFGEMAKALDAGNPDVKKVEEATTKAHDGWHDFSHEVWDHLAKEAKVSGADDSHEHE